MSMDSVRFGRALGVGARAAAKTLVTAVDAAATPNPSPARKPEQKNAGKAAASGERLGQQVARSATQAVETTQGLKRGGKRRAIC